MCKSDLSPLANRLDITLINNLIFFPDFPNLHILECFIVINKFEKTKLNINIKCIIIN